MAKDVAEWIEYTKTVDGFYNVSAILNTIEDSEKLLSVIMIAGQSRKVLMLTEDGLYEVLMQSRKPISKAFKTQR